MTTRDLIDVFCVLTLVVIGGEQLVRKHIQKREDAKESDDE